MEKLLFNQQNVVNNSKNLRSDLNSYAFSQKLARTVQKIEARVLSCEERRSILNKTFALGNKLFFSDVENCPDINKIDGYNLRFIELEYCAKPSIRVSNLFSKKIA